MATTSKPGLCLARRLRTRHWQQRSSDSKKHALLVITLCGLRARSRLSADKKSQSESVASATFLEVNIYTAFSGALSPHSLQALTQPTWLAHPAFMFLFLGCRRAFLL